MGRIPDPPGKHYPPIEMDHGYTVAEPQDEATERRLLQQFWRQWFRACGDALSPIERRKK
jgi:hypothetical protein